MLIAHTSLTSIRFLHLSISSSSESATGTIQKGQHFYSSLLLSFSWSIDAPTTQDVSTAWLVRFTYRTCSSWSMWHRQETDWTFLFGWRLFKQIIIRYNYTVKVLIAFGNDAHVIHFLLSACFLCFFQWAFLHAPLQYFTWSHPVHSLRSSPPLPHAEQFDMIISFDQLILFVRTERLVMHVRHNVSDRDESHCAIFFEMNHTWFMSLSRTLSYTRSHD